MLGRKNNVQNYANIAFDIFSLNPDAHFRCCCLLETISGIDVCVSTKRVWDSTHFSPEDSEAVLD